MTRNSKKIIRLSTPARMIFAILAFLLFALLVPFSLPCWERVISILMGLGALGGLGLLIVRGFETLGRNFCMGCIDRPVDKSQWTDEQLNQVREIEQRIRAEVEKDRKQNEYDARWNDAF